MLINLCAVARAALVARQLIAVVLSLPVQAHSPLSSLNNHWGGSVSSKFCSLRPWCLLSPLLYCQPQARANCKLDPSNWTGFKMRFCDEEVALPTGSCLSPLEGNILSSFCVIPSQCKIKFWARNGCILLSFLREGFVYPFPGAWAGEMLLSHSWSSCVARSVCPGRVPSQGCRCHSFFHLSLTTKDVISDSSFI